MAIYVFYSIFLGNFYHQKIVYPDNDMVGDIELNILGGGGPCSLRI